MSGFALGRKSLANLRGVDPILVNACKRGIELTMQDFSVFEGLRTKEKQREYVKRGVSWTMNSYHLTGRAVDLVPYIDGGVRWEWVPIYEVTKAMWYAFDEQRTLKHIRWGGVWDKMFGELDPENLEDELTKYHNRIRLENVKRRAEGKRPKKFRPDGPHFEIRRK